MRLTPPTHQAAGGEPVSLARALLCVPCIQTGVAKALLFRMAEASLDETSSLPAAVLSQFPWLEQVTDPEVLVKTLLTETFAVCSDAVKQGACVVGVLECALLSLLLTRRTTHLQPSSTFCLKS